jgi:hypothetical protein
VRSQQLADILVRAACFLTVALFILWPLLAQGNVGVFPFVVASPFVLAGFAPRLMGPFVGKGVMMVATRSARFMIRQVPSASFLSVSR